MIVAICRSHDLISPNKTNFTLRLTWNGASAYRNSEYGVWMDDMKRFYERVMTSNRTLDVNVYFEKLASGTLAQCGPGNASDDSNFFTGIIGGAAAILADLDLNMGNWTARTTGCTVRFNTDYYKVSPSNSTERYWKEEFFGTAIHEIFHGLGIGSLWNGPFRITADFGPLGVTTLVDAISPFKYNNIGTGNPSSPSYDASSARAEYRSEMGKWVGGVWSAIGSGNAPIENRKGNGSRLGSRTLLGDVDGTALAHWRGDWDGTDPEYSWGKRKTARGQDSADEIFTTWSSGAGDDRWIGRYSIASLRDIGYSVDLAPLEIALKDWRSV